MSPCQARLGNISMIRTQAQKLIAEIDETSDDPFWQECGTPYPGIWMESPRSSLSESQVTPFVCGSVLSPKLKPESSSIFLIRFAISVRGYSVR